MKVKVRVLDTKSNTNVPGWGELLQPLGSFLTEVVAYYGPDREDPAALEPHKDFIKEQIDHLIEELREQYGIPEGAVQNEAESLVEASIGARLEELQGEKGEVGA